MRVSGTGYVIAAVDAPTSNRKKRLKTGVGSLQLLQSRVQDRLIIPLDGLDRIVPSVALIARARLGGIDAPGDEVEEPEGEVDVREECRVDLLRYELATGAAVFCPVFKVADEFVTHCYFLY